MKTTYTRKQEATVRFAKKWIMPDEVYTFDDEVGQIKFVCRMVEGYDMKLFVFIKDVLTTMYILKNNQKWVEEKAYAQECYVGDQQ